MNAENERAYCGVMMPPTRERAGSVTPRWSFSVTPLKAVSAGSVAAGTSRLAPQCGQTAGGFVSESEDCREEIGDMPVG